MPLWLLIHNSTLLRVLRTGLPVMLYFNDNSKHWMRRFVYFSYRICRFLMFLMSICLSAVLPPKEAMVYPFNFRFSVCFICVLSRYYPCLFWAWPGGLVCHHPCPELLLQYCMIFKHFSHPVKPVLTQSHRFLALPYI